MTRSKGLERTHAKPRQEYGVEPLSPDAGRGADAERKVELERTHAKTAKDAKQYRGGRAGENV